MNDHLYERGGPAFLLLLAAALAVAAIFLSDRVRKRRVSARAFYTLALAFIILVVAWADQAHGAPAPPPPLDGPVTALSPAVRTATPGRLLFVGDSMAWELCPYQLHAVCVAFPGGFVADPFGTNHLANFLTLADVQANDVVLMSATSGFHGPGIDDAELVGRAQDAIARVRATGADLTMLIAPEEGFPACGPRPTPVALANFGQDRSISCATMAVLRTAVIDSGVRTLVVYGPYLDDQIHQTPWAAEVLAANAHRPT